MVTPRKKPTKRQREITARRDELVARYVAESTLESAAEKETLAIALAVQVVHLERLHEQEAAGTISAEESLSILASTSNIRRIAADLGFKVTDTKPLSDAELLGYDPDEELLR